MLTLIPEEILRSLSVLDHRAESFLAFCDFEYSKFLSSFLTFFLKIEQQPKENTVLLPYFGRGSGVPL